MGIIKSWHFKTLKKHQSNFVSVLGDDKSTFVLCALLIEINVKLVKILVMVQIEPIFLLQVIMIKIICGAYVQNMEN